MNNNRLLIVMTAHLTISLTFWSQWEMTAIEQENVIYFLQVVG